MQHERHNWPNRRMILNRKLKFNALTKVQNIWLKISKRENVKLLVIYIPNELLIFFKAASIRPEGYACVWLVRASSSSVCLWTWCVLFIPKATYWSDTKWSSFFRFETGLEHNLKHGMLAIKTCFQCAPD